jgi:anti-sigma B factor antagonist
MRKRMLDQDPSGRRTMHEAPTDGTSAGRDPGTGNLGEGEFGYDVADDADGVVVALRGELDLAAAPGLQRELLNLLERPVRSLTLDLGGLTFLDSSGLGSLYRLRLAADEHGVPLRLDAVPDHVMRVLDVTAMTPLFDLSTPGS